MGTLRVWELVSLNGFNSSFGHRKALPYNQTKIVTDSQSSMDTVRPALLSNKHRFRNYKQAHITLACRDHLPSHNEVEIVKV